MKRSVFSLFLAAILLFHLIACGNSETGSTVSTESASQEKGYISSSGVTTAENTETEKEPEAAGDVVPSLDNGAYLLRRSILLRR